MKVVSQTLQTMKTSLPLLALILIVGCAGPQKRYRKTSTDSLRVRHAQIVEVLGPDVRSSDFSYTPPGLAGLAFRNPKEERIKEKQEIEVELLRRWQAGDKAAHLPLFDR